MYVCGGKLLMIREFVESDYKYLNHNKYSSLEENMVVEGYEGQKLPSPCFVFNDSSWYKYTLERDGVKAIICYNEGADNIWSAFLLLSNNLTILDIKNIKINIYDMIKKHNADMVWTISEDCPVIDRWHKFLGMNKDDFSVIVNGKKYNRWILQWD